MADEAVFTLSLPTELRDDFLSRAAAFDRPAEQIVRELMEQFVAERPATTKEYDEWFRAEVEQALREADDPNAEFISNEEVMAELEEFERGLLERLNGKSV